MGQQAEISDPEVKLMMRLSGSRSQLTIPNKKAMMTAATIEIHAPATVASVKSLLRSKGIENASMVRLCNGPSRWWMELYISC